MDSRYRKFLALAETGSFSAAARSLHVTQPAITLAVASLEHTLNTKLYLRATKPIALTDEGRIVAQSARAMAAEIEEMHHRLRGDTAQVSCHVGLIDSIAHLLYDSDRERTILSGVEVVVDNSRRILRDLLGNKIDIGVITGQPKELGLDYMVRKLRDEEFVFVAAPGRVSSGLVNRVDDWLATNPDSTTYEHFLDLFRRKRMHVTPIFHSASMELLRDMAIDGQGTALLPRHIVRSALMDGSLAVVNTKPLYRPIWSVTRRQDYDARITDSLAIRVNSLLTAE